MCYQPNTIIIADDDVDDSSFLAEAIGALNPELAIINVPNGQMLVEVLDSIAPDFIFLDINMPKKNGFEALKQIRSNKFLDQPIVIMCSTSGSPADIKLSQELGANMYLKKPNDIKSLNRMVEEVFKIDWRNEGQKSILRELMMVNSNRGKAQYQ